MALSGAARRRPEHDQAGAQGQRAGAGRGEHALRQPRQDQPGAEQERVTVVAGVVGGAGRQADALGAPGARLRGSLPARGRQCRHAPLHRAGGRGPRPVQHRRQRRLRRGVFRVLMIDCRPEPNPKTRFSTDEWRAFQYQISCSLSGSFPAMLFCDFSSLLSQFCRFSLLHAFCSLVLSVSVCMDARQLCRPIVPVQLLCNILAF